MTGNDSVAQTNDDCALAHDEAREAFAKGAIIIDPKIATPQRARLARSMIKDGRRQWRRERHVPPAHERPSLVVEDSVGLRIFESLVWTRSAL